MAPASKDKGETAWEGFESSDDSSHASDTEIPKPALAAAPRKDRTLTSTSEPPQDAEGEPTVLYLGRIPHGFHEHEMAAYFAQFGALKRLRLARNKKTGHSKHYAFVEFADAGVARIAAQTMDRYLLFGHILRCRLVPPAEVHPDLWRGAGRRYKVMPRNRLEGSALKRGRGREEWAERVKRERTRRLKKGNRLKQLGIEYEFEGPGLVGVEEVKRIEGVQSQKEDETELTADRAVAEVAAAR